MLCPHAQRDFKKLLFVSLAVHLSILVMVPLLERGNSYLGSPFTVYGAYSAKPTYVLFKGKKTTARLAVKSKEGAMKAKKTRKKKTVSSKVPPVKVPTMKKNEKRALPEHAKGPQKLIPSEEKKQQSIACKRKQFEKVSETKEAKKRDEKVKRPLPEKKLPSDGAPTDVLNPEKPESFEATGDALVSIHDQKYHKYQQHIQQEVARLWKPPLGVSQGVECVVLFSVSEMGKVVSFKVEQPSKIVIYDLSILRIAKDFNFDKSLWGKKFTITFRQ